MADNFIGNLLAIEQFHANRQRQQQQANLQREQFGLQQQIKQAELNRFMQQDNLRSMVQGALELKGITDPAQREAYLKNRIAEIKQRGGDARDSEQLLGQSKEQQDASIQNVISIGEKFGIIKPDVITAQKQPKLFPGETQKGEGVFLYQDPVTGLPKRAGSEFRPPSKNTETFYDRDGNVIFQRGKAPGPTKGAQTSIEKKIAGNTEALANLNRISGQFKREYLTYFGRFRQTISSLKSKLGGELSKEDKTFLQNRRKFVQGVNQTFNAYRTAVTGAAASIREIEDLKKATINEKLSPDEFTAALDEYQSALMRSNRILRRLLREGFQKGDKAFGKEFDRIFKGGGDDSLEARYKELKSKGIARDKIGDILLNEGYQVGK